MRRRQIIGWFQDKRQDVGCFQTNYRMEKDKISLDCITTNTFTKTKQKATLKKIEGRLSHYCILINYSF